LALSGMVKNVEKGAVEAGGLVRPGAGPDGAPDAVVPGAGVDERLAAGLAEPELEPEPLDVAGNGDGRTARSRRGVSLVVGVPPAAAHALVRASVAAMPSKRVMRVTSVEARPKFDRASTRAEPIRSRHRRACRAAR